MDDTPRLGDGEGRSTPEPPFTWGQIGDALRALPMAARQWAQDRRIVVALLAAILLMGAILRFTGLDWDEHQHLHPDERFLTMVENSLTWPKSLGEYFDTAANPLNPNNQGHGMYVYGLLPVVVTKFVGQVLGKTGYDGIYLVGRALSGIADLCSIGLVFLIGRRLYDARVGLAGALMLALSALSIQQSHYFTVDNFTTLFVTLALYATVRVAQGRGLGSVLLLGVAFGLAVSCKISVLTFLAVIGLAFLVRIAPTDLPQPLMRERRARLGRFALAWRIESDPACGDMPPLERLALRALQAAPAALLLLLVAFWVFRIVQPQAFTGPGLLGIRVDPKWRETMAYIRDLVAGKLDYPPSHQWTARAPVLYMLQHMVLWGLGLPLGVAVWASWAGMGWALIRRRWAHLLPWAWFSLTFFYQSIQFVKTVRYLLPIYPVAALMAGWGLVRLWDWAKKQTRAWARRASLAAIAAVVLGTAGWAFAFTGIYTRPVTRVAASRWMYANIPRGSTLTCELWDDALPLNIDGRLASSDFRQVRMDPYWEDVPEKRDKLIEWLAQADYIVLSSNRLWASIPRLSMRYPMTTRYYEALFSGELGFDRLRTFTSRPRLLGIEIRDDEADESFTVYDHPKVIIFHKRADFDLERVRAMFVGYDLDRVVRIMPRQVTTAPNQLMLTDDEWAAQRAGGTWSRLFHLGSLANRAPVPIWLALVLVLGWVTFPLAFAVFRGLRDRGYPFARLLGVLLVAYGAWLLPSLKLLPATRGLAWAMVGLLTLAGGLAAWRQRDELHAFVRARWRLLVSYELLFLVFFVVLLLIRRGNPELWHPAMGGERPMDLAYLNAILRSTSYPPYDPWFAGGAMNYYYFGWVLAAALIKLTGIVPWVAYNLILPTWFGFLAVGAAGLVYNLIPAGRDEDGWLPRALRYGLGGSALVAVLGNLGEVRLLAQGLGELGQELAFHSILPGLEKLARIGAGLWAVLTHGAQLRFRPEWWYWNASRVMPNGEINEFPFFSFLYGDLHAHVLAMPLALLALACALSWALGKYGPHPRRRTLSADRRTLFHVWERVAGVRDGGVRANNNASCACDSRSEPKCACSEDAAGRQRNAVGGWPDLGLLAVSGLTLGALWCSNSWDYPTYTLIVLAALVVGLWAQRPRLDAPNLWGFALRAVGIVALSVLLFVPFRARFGRAYSQFEAWKGPRTALGDYLVIHGLFLLILAVYLLNRAFGHGARGAMVRTTHLLWGRRRRRAAHLMNLFVRCPSLLYSTGWVGLALLAAVWLLLVLAGAWIWALTLPLLGLAIALTLEPRASPAQRLVTGLMALGLGLTLAVELVALKGDIGRMNTVFKLYVQVWSLWGVACTAALAQVAVRARGWARPWRNLWRWALGLLVAGAALYPLCATVGKVRDRWDVTQPGGLDGMAYMHTARYQESGQTLVLEHDRQAILWMLENIPGSPVIAEANTGLYRWGGRISSYTGLSTILGWDWHQKQQRAAYSGTVVDWRLEDVQALYDSPDPDVARRILARYQVEYIYVGELERAYYDPDGVAKFEAMLGEDLEIAYRAGPVTIYRVLTTGSVTLQREGVPARTSAPVAMTLGQQAADGALTPARRRADPLPRRGRGCICTGEGFETHASPTWLAWLRDTWIPARVRAEGPAEADVLMLDMPVEDLSVVRDRGWNTWAARSPAASIAYWWLMVQFLGLAAWPLVRLAFPRGDGGYALSKALGLLLVGYLVWIGASLRWWPNTMLTAWVTVLGLVMVGVATWRFAQRHGFEPLNWRLIALEEGLFTLAFGGLLATRLLNPDLWQPWFGGEKMMEMAMLNAIGRSAYMPPYDPYFAGGILNYYYFGHFLVNVLCKLTGLPAEIAFNLAVPTLYGLLVVHVFWVGYHLAPGARATVGRLARRGVAAGLAAVALAGVLGNLTGAEQRLSQLADLAGPATSGLPRLAQTARGLALVVAGGATLPPFDYWYAATRVIPGAISEFPFFTFLFADLHPHLINLPLTAWVVALALAPAAPNGRIGNLARWAWMALGLGALGATNTWDLPGYLAVAAVGIYLAAGRGQGLAGLARALATICAVAVIALALFAPFYAHYRPQYVGLAWVRAGEHSALADLGRIWGLVSFAAFSAIIWGLRRAPLWRLVRVGARRRRWLAGTHWRARVAVGGALGLALLTWAGYAVARGSASVAVLALGCVAGAFALALHVRRREAPAYALLFGGTAILLGTELVYLRDFLAGSDWQRMNTVFKFGLQSWMMLSLGAAALLPGLWRAARGLHIWRPALGLLAAAALIYTVSAVPARVTERFPNTQAPVGTLDGTAYMMTARYTWPDDGDVITLQYDREAIAWLWEHSAGTPILLEAPVGFYREGGLRVSSYTGLPTLVGAHESEQRPWDQVTAREEAARQLYTGEDLREMLSLLQAQHVRYIYVGALERILYGDGPERRFDELVAQGWLERAYANEGAVIYRVVEGLDTVMRKSELL